MKYTVPYLYCILFIVLLGIIYFNSCSSEAIAGCTDNTSQNFNPEATEDDGSCFDKRDAILGNYIGTSECNVFTVGLSSANFEVSIGKFGRKNEVKVDLACCDQLVFNGTLSGTTIIVDDEITISSIQACGSVVTGTVQAKGSFKLIGNVLSTPNLTFTIKNLNGDEVCNLSCAMELTKRS